MPTPSDYQRKEISAEFSRAHVVIVDDDPTNRVLLRSVCEKIGIGIIDEAENGLIALELINKFRPDLILLDVLMPQMDGLELMLKLKANPALDGMPILVQTSLKEEDDRVRCFNSGATDVVSRPFNMSELRARISAHLRSAISSRVLFDFRNRIQAHIEITHAFLDAILPTTERANEIAMKYGLKCSSAYLPHDEIGGDLWSLRPLDADNLAVVLIDASAHGLAGAINALRVDCLVQQFHDYLSEPDVFIKNLDAAMAKISFGQLFAGAVVLNINKNTGVIKYAGSGIPSPLLLQNGKAIELVTGGLPMGSGMVTTTKQTVTMEHGASLALFSDGWIESITEEASDILLDACADGIVPEKLVPKGDLLDDLTLVALQRR